MRLRIGVALALCAGTLQVHAARTVIVDTGQLHCYGLRGESIAAPAPGSALDGQDAQYRGAQPSYRGNGDGTVTDLNTGLTWQKTPPKTPVSWEDAIDYADALKVGGHGDWRLPTIKELLSIVDFSGSIRTRTPYIDTDYFDYHYPDRSTGVRDIDAQYWSTDRYVGTVMRGDEGAFGFNFADGRIKVYPVSTRHGRGGKQNFVRCVRGLTGYGENAFADNGDGTVTDAATGLTWMQTDSSQPMRWADALAYAEDLELGGHSDWRLPNAKELQSIVDYSKAPDARDAAQRGPAIDPVFSLTEEESWHWTSTTHGDDKRAAVYICFGRGLSAWDWNGEPMNAHGAGALRSDPKVGSASQFPNGRGPQGDEIRVLNYVRCVRGGDVVRTVPDAVDLAVETERPARGEGRGEGDGERPPRRDGAHFVERLDRDGDNRVSREEFDGPARHFDDFDRDGDGFISAEEAPTGPPPRRGKGRRGRSMTQAFLSSEIFLPGF